VNDPLLQRFQALLEGRYAIERELGRGGMATVYLARDLRHGRTVAIKLLQPEITTSLTAERFLREIQITAKLQHPNILGLFDSGAEDGLCYYVMPHVEGESLRDRLLWEKQLGVETAVDVAIEVCSALAYAHSRGVVHRDIKPENILFSAGHAIVADFGIARAVSEGQRTITAVGIPLGTPPYMSPEQAQGLDNIDHRSDLYALGCMLFEMVAGRQGHPAAPAVAAAAGQRVPPRRPGHPRPHPRQGPGQRSRGPLPDRRGNAGRPAAGGRCGNPGALTPRQQHPGNPRGRRPGSRPGRSGCPGAGQPAPPDHPPRHHRGAGGGRTGLRAAHPLRLVSIGVSSLGWFPWPSLSA
jgi:serine/threonine protein kinase